ncbi:MAG: leucine-rich repeat domain-containing protein, partial [Flavobacteriales bacterium]|nr:leucine-rich repeat domain-containing protein [Flavobacteriales bacterium]
LKTVLLSQDNLTTIGYGAFSGCEDLIDITLPTNSNYTSIEERTFQTCTSLLTINIPTNITSIGSNAFYGCNKLNIVNLNGGLTNIATSAFEYCALTFMNFPPSITSIGTAAFMNNKIDTITLPISFGNAAINYVDDNWLKTVFGYSENMKLEYYYIFAPIDPNSTTLTQTDVFTSLNKWQLADIFTASTFNAYIADHVTIIDEYAFQNIKNLSTLSICSAVKEIKTGAFQSSGLQHFYVGTNYDAMPNSQLTTIGNNVFSNCNNMTNILIPDNVTNLGDSVFYNSTNLSEVTFNANTKIESIGSFTFAYCVNLTILRIPKSIKTIGDYAFAYCNNLLDIVLPNSLNRIGNNAFTDCNNVTSFVVPYNVTDICNNAFENINIPSTANVFISSKFKTNIDSIFYTQIFEDSNAYKSALNNFNDNIDTFNRWIWVKKGMTSIANSNMGSANHTLASQEGYFTPQNTAWWNWAVPELNADYSLAKPSAIAWINNRASAQQGNVNNLNISQADWFISQSYRPLLNAKMILSNMPTQNQGFNSKIFNYHYVFTSADVSSTGTLTSDDVSKVIGAINSNFTVDIGDGITSIAASAFDGYNNKMSGLTISSKTITSIGANAFNGCSLLYGALYIPASVREVGDSAFDGCTNINNIIIEEGKLNNIGTSAFSGTGILSIYIPKSVTSLGDNSFSKCQKMKTVILPLNVSGNVPKHSSLDKSNFFSTGNTSTITYQTFTMINPILSNGNYIITKQVVQDAIGSVEYQDTTFNLLITHTDPSANTADIQIETGAFQNMTNLYRLTMNNVSEIGAYAFSGCSKLQMVTIDNSIQTIGRNAFTSTNLLTVKIPSRMYNVCNSGYFTSTQPKLGGQPMYVFYCIFTTNQPSGILTNTEVYEQVGVDSSSPVGISITFDNTVQILNNNLFDGAKYISNINIPDNIEYIGDYAFANCTNLITLICSNTNPQLSQIGIDAFNGCTDLSMVHLPNSLLDIGKGAFLGCTSLWTVRLPRIFDFDLMTRSSNYFEALRTNEGANWKSDDPNNATGTFFTFDFSTMGAVGKYYSYSYQKSLYIYNEKVQQEEKIEAHEKVMHFWDEVATIGIEVVVCAAVIVLTGGVASALAGETALGEGAAAAEAGGGAASMTLGGLAVAATLSTGERDAKAEIKAESEKLIDGGLFTGNLLSAASNTIMMDSLKNRTATYGSMIGIYTIPTTYLNNYYVVHTDGSWKITTTLTVSNSSIDSDTMINDYRQAIESFVKETEHIDIPAKDIIIRAHHTANNTSDHIYTLTATIPTDYDKVTDQHKSNVEKIIKKQLVSKHLDNDAISFFISDICFPKNTPIKTDQGIVYIEHIDTHKHTINNKAIVSVTKTTSNDSYLVGFKKNSLGENYPSKDTVMSKEHKLMYNGKMYEAKKFLNKNTGVFKVKYNGEILYNILLDEHSTINVNNL